MFGKKTEQKQEAKLEESLGLWQNLGRKAFEFLGSERVDLRTLPGFELSQLFEQAQKTLKASNEEKGAIEKLKNAFELSRKEEVKFLNQYILGLRGLLWSALNTVQEQRGSAYQESVRMDSLKDKMLRALDSDDLLQMKLVVKDWIVLHNQIQQDRKKEFDESQANFHRQLARLQNELYQMQSEMKLDGLTQVYNRKAFDTEVAKSLSIAQLSGRPSALLLFDIDHFKNVNDTYGHPIGDKVLQAFAKLLVQNFPMRSDFVARYGGEEFVVLMSDCDLSEAAKKAEKFVTVLRRNVMSFGNVSLRITASIGIAGSKPFEKVEDWIKRSDELLYQAKRDGRDCYLVDKTNEGSAA